MYLIANVLPCSYPMSQFAQQINSLMYLGVKNTRLRSLATAQLTLPWALGDSTNAPWALGDSTSPDSTIKIFYLTSY